jgi:antitoxin component YwqK of YwqJK toxin-antitoxin module
MDRAASKLRLAGALGLRVAFAIAVSAPVARAEQFSVTGSCRDGVPHGAWQLKTSQGAPRALGAFSHGKRTSSFIFWNASGVRIAHLPFEDDLRNGTVAAWRERPAKNGEGAQRLEAVYAMGKLHGIKRVWHPDGRVRGEYTYADATLVEAKAWDAQGRALAPPAARAQAGRDHASDEAFFATLDALVAAHLPGCRNGGNGAPSAPR